MIVFTKEASPQLVVLGYHGISRDGDFPSWLRVNASTFDRQLRSLKKIGNFIRPEDLFNPARLERNRLNLLLTFDDCYYNNYSVGFPIIRKHGIPALFLVSTWNMQTGQTFWFDRIIQPIQCHNIGSLDLRQLGLGEYRFSRRLATSRWDHIQALLEDIKREDKAQDGNVVEEIVENLQHICLHRELQPDQGDCRPIAREQIVEMHRSGFCHFGSHAHRHVILTGLTDDELARELRASRAILEEIVGESILHIGYPNGNVDERIKRACRDAGYRFGFSTSRGVVGCRTDEMEIPRLLVGGFDSTAKVLWNVARVLLQKRTHGA